MSKYKEIKTQINKREFICKALDELGVPYEVAEPGQKLALVNYWGRAQGDQADVVVRRQHLTRLSNDLGWTVDPDTGAYVEIISEFDAENRIAKQVRQKAAFYQLEELAYANGYSLNVVEEHGVQRVFVGGGA